MAFFAQLIITGLAIGIIYGVIALSIVLIYKSTHVFNFAQGELLIIGAFFAVIFLNLSPSVFLMPKRPPDLSAS